MHADVETESVNAYLRIGCAHTKKVTVVAPSVCCDVCFITDQVFHFVKFWIVLADQFISVYLAVIDTAVGAGHKN